MLIKALSTLQQLGSLEKVLEFYNKKDELSFRDELYQLNKIPKTITVNAV